MPRRRHRSVLVALLSLIGALAFPASAQDAPAEPSTEDVAITETLNPYEGRLITEVRLVGLERVSEQFVRNQLRSTTGRPLEWETVREDVRRLERIGQFRDIQADVQVNPDLSVAVVFLLDEAPLIEGVYVVGNRQVADEVLRGLVTGPGGLQTGVPLDEYQIGRAQRLIEREYRERGFYLVDVTIDESELESSGVIVLRVREGERIKIKAIRFEGNESIQDARLRSRLETETSGILRKGPLDLEILDRDVGTIIDIYRDEGFLDARADREIQPSPNGKEAIITFVVDEGQQYTLRDVFVEHRGYGDTEVNEQPIYTAEQIRALMPIKRGDVFGIREVQAAVTAIGDVYRKQGWINAEVNAEQYRATDRPVVDLRIYIDEGERVRTGFVSIVGNTLTQSKVVRRQVQIRPDHWLDATGVDDTRDRLDRVGLFERGSVRVTVQPENPRYPGYRDVLIEVEETDTGSINFGAAVSSDAGLAGGLSLDQRNFDLFDTPDSFDEFVTGRAFRGAGQTFNLLIQPGTEVSTYSLGITEPWLFDSPYSLGSNFYFRNREFDDYDEERLGTRLRLARRFGERWVGAVNTRVESIDLSNIDRDAPVDVYEVEDRNLVTGVGFELTRTTVDNRFRPTRGTRTEIGIEQVGAFGGDFDFTRLSVDHTVFIPLTEDYLGRKTVLSLTTRTAYIPQEDEAPVYERLYLGGRSFRGFEFRGIGPVGIRNDTGRPGSDHVGGDFLFFFGAEIEQPIWRDLFSVVGFVDTGTVEDDFGFESYRVSVGVGIRLYVPQLSQAPLAFDFGFPVISEDTDDDQLFSFSIDLPF